MKTSIVLFRRDLRLQDNPAFFHATNSGQVVLLYIKETDNSLISGGASNWWLHHSLNDLKNRIEKIGGQLFICEGKPFDCITNIAKQTGASKVFWNRRYEPHNIPEDTKLKKELEGEEIEVNSFCASLLSEPWKTLNKQEKPYKVFTPYWRHCLANLKVPEPLPEPSTINFHPINTNLKDCVEGLDKLKLLDTKVNWAAGIQQEWQIGEYQAQEKWQRFLEETVNKYKDQRNLPSVLGTSRLSPHICFGEISVRQIWHDLQNGFELDTNPDAACYLSEIGWREFSYYLLYHFPHMVRDNYNPKFDHFVWRDNHSELLKAWQQGNTGYPIIDAGMRELWHTGYMHNRVRMVVASFLCKHLLIHWRHGADWFWDTLLDADLASNTASWQWVAGCGADAAPYFRIFNPVTQGEKFDKTGEYTRHWVPEIAALENKYLHQPWNAPFDSLSKAKIRLGDTYPKPIVDHADARALALETYSQLKRLG